MLEHPTNIYLRKIDESDTEDIIRWRNNEEVRKFFIRQEPFTKEGHTNWLKSYVETGKAVQFIIVDKVSDRSLGSVYLRDIDLQHKKAEFGIFIGEEDFRGKGYGTEAVQLILRYGFEEMKLNKIFLRVLSDNIGAIKSYQKAGFTQEGYFKKDVFIDPQYRDVIFMAILKEEFEHRYDNTHYEGL